MKEHFPENINSYSNVTGRVRHKFINSLIHSLRRLLRKYRLSMLVDLARKTGLDQFAINIVNKNVVPLESSIRTNVDENISNELRRYFEKDIQQLEILINRDLSAWR